MIFTEIIFSFKVKMMDFLTTLFQLFVQIVCK